jgi:hypothetical protein
VKKRRTIDRSVSPLEARRIESAKTIQASLGQKADDPGPFELKGIDVCFAASASYFAIFAVRSSQPPDLQQMVGQRSKKLGEKLSQNGLKLSQTGVKTVTK